MKNQQKKELVVQSNQLIEAHYRLTLQEKRLILWLISQIHRDDTDFKKYKLNIIDFAEMLKINPETQYKELKKVTGNLMTRLIQIDNPETKATKQMAWLCFAHWEPKRGICSLEFHPELKPYLLQLKEKFTQIEFPNFLGLNSVYSVRILELLLQYENIGKRITTVTELRLWCGIQKDEYELYTNLKSRIIHKAKTEINAKTEYEIDYREIKESRKIVAIEWIINKKTYFEKSQIEKAEKITKEYRSELALIEHLNEYGLSKIASKILIKNHTEETVTNALKAVELQVSKGNVKNPKAMIQTAVKEQWRPDVFVKN
jgi:plasmid replication initiation protein